jgi:hypothetical protein
MEEFNDLQDSLQKATDTPPYYQALDGTDIECIDAIRAALGLEGTTTFIKGTIMAYTWRLGRKTSGGLEDAMKIRNYIEFLIMNLQELAMIQEPFKEMKEFDERSNFGIVDRESPPDNADESPTYVDPRLSI